MVFYLTVEDPCGGTYQSWQQHVPPPPLEHVVKMHPSPLPAYTNHPPQPPPPAAAAMLNSSGGSGSNYSGGEILPPPFFIFIICDSAIHMFDFLLSFSLRPVAMFG